jgi:hypothetical protein
VDLDILCAKRLRHKQQSSFIPLISFIPFPFCTPTQPQRERLSFFPFSFTKQFFHYQIKIFKYGLQTAFKADVPIMGNSAEKKRQSFPLIGGCMGNFSE